MTKKPKLTLVRPSTTGQAPPRALGKHGLTLWRDVTTAYVVTDVGGIELLAQACAAAQRAEDLAALIVEEGEVIRTKNGIKAHPCIGAELSARSFVVRTLARLGITTESVKPMGRPPHLG